MTRKLIQPFRQDYLWPAIGLFIYIAAYLSLNHGDLPVTCIISDAILKGHIFDLYDYIFKYVDGNQVAYFPSTYFLFALWNIPLTLLKGDVYFLRIPGGGWEGYGIGVYWSKLLPVMFYFLSAKIVNDILCELNIAPKIRKTAVLFWITVPLSFFSQFIFGQYDIFYVFFMLLGIKFFLQEKNILGAIMFGISFTFKYFPAIVFLPVIFYLFRKDFSKLVRTLALSLIPITIEFLLFYRSAGFIKMLTLGQVPNVSNGYFDRLFADGVLGVAKGSYFVLLLLLLVLIAYFNKNTFTKTHVLELACLSSSFFALFLIWNPQWILFSSALLAFLPFLRQFNMDDFKTYLILDILIMFFFTGVVSFVFPWNVDINMFKTMPLFRGINPAREGLTINLAYFFSLGGFLKNEVGKSIYFSGFFATWIFYLLYYFKFSKTDLDVYDLDILKKPCSLWLRFYIGALIFLLPAFVAYFAGQGIYQRLIGP